MSSDKNTQRPAGISEVTGGASGGFTDEAQVAMEERAPELLPKIWYGMPVEARIGALVKKAVG